MSACPLHGHAFQNSRVVVVIAEVLTVAVTIVQSVGQISCSFGKVRPLHIPRDALANLLRKIGAPPRGQYVPHQSHVPFLMACWRTQRLHFRVKPAAMR